ncbi:MAG: hypothetical protein PHW74_01185 [Desulfobacca sp.]|nr:hypothetical protein [Desulfobacca sp.]
MAGINTLLKLRSYLTDIVHHIPGRVRLRFSPGLLQQAGQIDLAVFDNLGIFKGIEVNPWALSVTITYDPNRLPPRLWEAFIKGDKAAEAQVSQLLADQNKSVQLTDGPLAGPGAAS